MLGSLNRWLRGAPREQVAPAMPGGSDADRPSFRTLPKPAGAGPYRAFADLPGSDPAMLAQIGRSAADRLLSNPAATRAPAVSLDMFVIPDFLTADACDRLIALIDADVKPSTSLRATGAPLRRTSETCRLSAEQPIVAEVERRIAELIGLPLAHSETIQGQRYDPGQFFRMHNDYIAGGQAYSDAFAREGGQRTWTAMVFLDEPEAGGHTSFPRAQIEVLPRRGTLLTWNNMAADGHPNAWSHHEGTPVLAGIKHVLTKWFRERPWTSSAESDALRH